MSFFAAESCKFGCLFVRLFVSKFAFWDKLQLAVCLFKSSQATGVFLVSLGTKYSISLDKQRFKMRGGNCL